MARGDDDSPVELLNYRGPAITRLPSLPTGDPYHFEDYIYVLRVGALVKVGITKRVRSRIAQHIKTYGPLTRAWISRPHLGGIANETALIGFCASRGLVSKRSREAFNNLDAESVIEFARTLRYPRFDVARWKAESEAAAAERRAYTQRTGFGSHITEFFSEDFLLVSREKWERTARLAGSSVAALFQRDGDNYGIPEVISDSVPVELAANVAAVARCDIDDVLDMDYIDFLQAIGFAFVRAEADLLRRHAAVTGRDDLLSPIRSAAHGSLKPTTDIESTSPRS
jgi:hypothetical protein